MTSGALKYKNGIKGAIGYRQWAMGRSFSAFCLPLVWFFFIQNPWGRFFYLKLETCNLQLYFSVKPSCHDSSVAPRIMKIAQLMIELELYFRTKGRLQ